MTVSPRFEDKLLLTFAVVIDGVPLPETAVVESLEIEADLNCIPYATVTLVDGDRSKERFDWSASESFLPGKTIRIEAGYHNANAPIFNGMIVRHGLRIDGTGGAHLVLTCADRAVLLTVGRSSAQYLDMSDAEILSDVIAAAGLTADVPASDTRPEATVRHDATDWDFILMRAAAIGRVVRVQDGTVRVAPPEFATPDLVVQLGDAVEMLDLELDASAQRRPPGAVSWDPAAQDIIEASAAEPAVNQQGDLDGAALAQAIGIPETDLRSFAAHGREALQGWADARLLAARLARIRGRLSMPGTAKLALGGTVKLAGLGPRFDGRAYVSGVRHRLEAGSWSTEARIGFDPLAAPEKTAGINGPTAGGLRPAIRGLQIAKVKQIHDDPKGERRVKVTLPLAKGQSDGIWVRILCSYATEGAGAVFMPETGDEVVLGFLDDDPQSAILLGALQSSARPAPYAPDAENTIKAIVTKGQLKIELEDVKKIVTISTPGGQVLTLSDDATQIRLEDATGNMVDLSPSGISIDSPGDVKITAKGKIEIEGTTGVTATSPADVELKGLNATLEADVAATAKGGATAELSASGQTTVKGALVMIN